MASISVRSGMTSTGITLNHNDYMTVASGGTAIDTTVKYAGYIFVSAGGVAESTTVSSGGTMDILEEGTANSTTVNIGGRIDVSSGGVANSTTVNSGGSMVVYSGGTATEIRENGGYVAERDGANATFVSNTIENLLFSDIDVTLHPVTTAYNAQGKYNGHLLVFGGKAIHTTVSLNARIFVMSGGIATETSVNSDGFLEVDSGCTANSTTVNDGGGFSVDSGGTANSTTVNDGGSMTVRGTANSTTIVSGGKLDIGVGGVMKNTVVSSGAYFILYNKDSIASNTTVCECGTLRVSNNATVDAATLNAGTLTIGRYGTAKGVIVNSDGNLSVFESGVANGATVSSGGILCVSAGGTAQDTRVNGGVMEIKSDGTANGTLVNDGGSLHAGGGGTLNNTTVYSGGTAIVSGNVGYQEFVVNGGELQVIEGGLMDQGFELTVMSRGKLIVRTEGIVDGAIIKESAVVTVGNGGILASAGVSAAKVTVYAGGCLDGVFLNSGSILDVSGGGSFVEDVCVSSGAVLTGVLHDPHIIDLTFSGGTLDLNIAKSSENDGFLVEGGAYSQFKTDEFSCTITVTNKQLNGTYKLIEGAAGFNKTITVKNSVGYQFGTLTVGSGPKELLDGVTYDLKLSGGNLIVVVTGGAIPDPIYSGGVLVDERKDITSGMSAIDVTVSAGGILNVFSSGEASNTTVYEDGVFNVHSAGDLRSATIHSGGTATLYEDATAHNVVVDGGALDIESGAFIIQTSKGKTVTSNIIVTNGGRVNVNGWVEGALVSGGEAVIESDGSMFSASVANGTVQVKDGAYAGLAILDGGIVNVESGGTAACTVSSGGTMCLEDGCDLNNGLRVNEGGVVTGVMHGITQVVKMYGGTLDFDISEAAPSGEYLFDIDANFDFDHGGICTLTVDGSQANGTYNLMESAYGFDTQVITAQTPLTVKSTGGSTLGTLTIGGTAEIDGMTYALNLSDDNNLTVTVEEGIPLPPEPPEPTPADDILFFTGDFDGSGKSMLATQKDGVVRIYSNGAEWGNGLALETGWEVVGTGDFNADKKDDFLRVNTEGYVVGEMSQGDGTFAAQVLNLKSAGWSILGTGDFNGNGSDDVLIANPTAASETVGLLGYWESGVTWTLINGYSAEWEMVSCGDFNGDGKCDMLWKNEFVGDGGLTYNAYCTWIVEPPAGQSDWRMVSVANPDEWNFLCSGDFNGDKMNDIAMINDVGVVGIWGVADGYLNSWSILSAVDPSAWALAGVGDFNGDGTDDIAWSNTDTGLTGYWQINNKELTTWANIATLQAV